MYSPKGYMFVGDLTSLFSAFFFALIFAAYFVLHITYIARYVTITLFYSYRKLYKNFGKRDNFQNPSKIVRNMSDNLPSERENHATYLT
jgi:hypothetical protein